MARHQADGEAAGSARRRVQPGWRRAACYGTLRRVTTQRATAHRPHRNSDDRDSGTEGRCRALGKQVGGFAIDDPVPKLTLPEPRPARRDAASPQTMPTHGDCPVRGSRTGPTISLSLRCPIGPLTNQATSCGDGPTIVRVTSPRLRLAATCCSARGRWYERSERCR